MTPEERRELAERLVERADRIDLDIIERVIPSGGPRVSTARYLIGDDGCWTWTGPSNNRGYGCWGRALAHRRMYEERVGPIPDGLELDHLCRNTLCVNPAHLEPVTHAENVRRSRVGAVNAQRMLARTHCKNGHEFTTDNTAIVAGYRRCRECLRAASRRHYHQRKGSL